MTRQDTGSGLRIAPRPAADIPPTADTYTFWYDGPGGESHYYRVRATETDDGAVVTVRNTVKGYSSPVLSSVVAAEDWITVNRHEIAMTR